MTTHLKTVYPPDTLLYWAITGRICGDEEDSALTFGPMTHDDAIKNFRACLRNEASLPDLDGEPDPETDRPEGAVVFINAVFYSTTIIEER